MASWWNDNLMKWQVDKIAKVDKRKVDEMIIWWNDNLMKW